MAPKQRSVQVKEGALSTVTKILQYSPPEMLRGLLGSISISSFVASLLAGREPAITAAAVRLAELLMLKLPDVFAPMFLKVRLPQAWIWLCLPAHLLACTDPYTKNLLEKPGM